MTKTLTVGGKVASVNVTTQRLRRSSCILLQGRARSKVSTPECE